MKHLDLFSGIGGFSLAADLVWGKENVEHIFCEIEEFPRKVLQKHWPTSEIHNDITKLDGKTIKDVFIATGGFPCQDLSQAGHMEGFAGDRSSLYSEMLRVIGESRPEFAVFENVTNLLMGQSGRWFAKFLYDLAEIGYDAEWHCIPASAVGAAHHRDRVWIIAYPNGAHVEGLHFPKSLFTHTEESRRRELTRAIDACLHPDDYAKMRSIVNDVPDQMGELKAYGNAIVPQVAAVIMQAIKDIGG